EHDQSPGQLAREDSVDDGGHEAGLRRGGLFAADAGDPLDLNLLGGGRVEVLAVGKLRGAESVEDDVFALLVKDGGTVGSLDLEVVHEAARVLLDGDAGMGGG